MDLPGLDELARTRPADAARLRALVARLRTRAEAADWAAERLPALVQARSRGGVLLALVEAIRALTGAPDVWAGTWQGSLADGTLSFSALAAVGEDVPAPRQVSRTIVAETLSSGLPIWSDEAGVDSRFGGAASVRAAGRRAIGCVPAGEGVVYLRDPGRPFPPETQARVEALCHLAGAFLDEPSARPPEADIPGLVGRSRPMRELGAAIRSFARMPWPALVLGDSGTGKEAVARALHAVGPRSAEPFVPVNCGAIPDELAESVLFGHERGAFTGAEKRREGLAERAGRGTLFLDEVGEAPPRLQVKLLRLLQEGVFERLGGTEELPFRGRVVAATWRPLTAPESTFRNDLFHRLAAGVLRVPPLRERRDDVPLLAEHLLARALSELPDRPTLTLGRSALAELAARDWPGNVRELDNTLKAAIARALAWGDDQIGPEHMDEAGPVTSVAEGPATGLLAATEAFQRAHVRRALESCGGNRSLAAEQLGVTRQWLHRLLARWGGRP